MNFNNTKINPDDIKKDVEVMLWSIKLESIRRFFHLKFWEQETRDAEYAKRAEPNPRLESVADHSWHLSDTILLIGRHYTFLDINKCLKLTILHDKMEIFTGDLKPIGRDGTGIRTYAFDKDLQLNKEITEKEAMDKYLSMLAPSALAEQSAILSEIIECITKEALFVKAVDKIQTLLFIYIKKKGNIDDKHLKFSLDYAEKALKYFPEIEPYYCEIRKRLIQRVAKRRSISEKEMESSLITKQSQLFDK